MKKTVVCWMSTKFPLELPAYFGMKVYCPESFAAASASKGRSVDYCRSAEQAGFCEDICSYIRIGLGICEEPEHLPIPKPDVLLCCTNICGNMLRWYRLMAIKLRVPLILLDVPYRNSNDVPSDQLSYLRKQFWNAVTQLETITEKCFDEQQFLNLCHDTQAVCSVWNSIMRMAKNKPSPLNNMELFDWMPTMVINRCEKETVDRLSDYLDEIKTRKKSGEKPFRVFLEGTPCWSEQVNFVEMLQRNNIQIVADTLSPSLSFQYTDIDSMLEAYCRTINGSSYEEGLEQREKLCREYGVEGILIHTNRSCRPWCGTLPMLQKDLSERLGVPAVDFSGDQADPRACSKQQMELRIQSLAEMMKTARMEKIE